MNSCEWCQTITCHCGLDLCEDHYREHKRSDEDGVKCTMDEDETE